MLSLKKKKTFNSLLTAIFFAIKFVQWFL